MFEDIPEMIFQMNFTEIPCKQLCQMAAPWAVSTQRSSSIRTSIYTMLMETVLVTRHRIHWAKNQFYKQLSD